MTGKTILWMLIAILAMSCVMAGKTTYVNDVVSPLLIAKVGTNAPTFDQTQYAYRFAHAVTNNSEQSVYIAFQLPHTYVDGTNMSCHIHAYPATNGLNTTVSSWSLSYRWYNYNASTNFTNVTATKLTQNFTMGTAYLERLFSFPTINGAGKNYSSTFVGELKRNTAENYTDDVYVDFFDCHIQNEILDVDRGRPMTSLGVIIALGIALAVFAYMAFVAHKDNVVWRALSLIMVVILLVLLSKTAIDANKICEVENGAVICYDGPSSGASYQFYRLMTNLMWLFFAYLLFSLFMQAVEYMKLRNKI